MDKKSNELQSKADELKFLIEKTKKQNIVLELNKSKLRLQTSRYQKIFDKSYISMWEEDVSDAFKLIDSLPCKTGEELSEYLINNPEITNKIIRRIKVIQINDYTIKLFESNSKKNLLNSLRTITNIVSIPGFIKLFKAMKDNLHHCSYETIAFTMAGRKLDILLTVYLPGKDKGNILISMIDISERKKHELTLKLNLDNKNEQKQKSEIFQNILLTLTSSLNKEEILKSILRETRKIVPYSSANIRLLENGYLRVAAEEGYDDYGAGEFIRNSRFLIKQLGEAEKYLPKGIIRIIPDTRKDSGWTEFPKTSFILGYIGLPIKWDNKTIGLLSLDSDKINTFSQLDADNLGPFVNAAAVALHNSHLFELATKEVLKRKTTEISIKKSLEEKEILLREIHHRVKNNLSLIMSLINLQSGMLPDKINPLIFEDLKQRVYTISLVHEKLYISKNLSSIDLESYLINLTESVKSSSIFKEGIKFTIKIEDKVEIEGDTLVPLALLLNELIVNSVKHAFPDTPGNIYINVCYSEKKHKIIFRDNGIGIPENREPSSSELGLFLVESLVSQINGNVSFHNDGGAVTTITFPSK